MELILVRDTFNPGETIGRIWHATPGPFTLEDMVRDGPKIYGETAIPEGRYQVVITYSNRFKRMLPELKNVPGFDAIRLHIGNTAQDTTGCILVGQRRDEHRVIWSGLAMDVLQPIIADAQARGTDVWLTVCSMRPPTPIQEGIPV